MTLITDGGSTKCDWVLLDTSGQVVLKTATKGLNPAVFPRDELFARIAENSDLASVFSSIERLHFYGAGCGTPTPTAILKEVLEELFPKATVRVQEDMVAAVFAATTEPGIVCILGTGSNSCYFDGSEIHTPIASLGYVIMDEASGNYYGKRLIRDYFYRRMPEPLATRFATQYNISADEIKLNLYKRSNPNAYLASFARFIFDPPAYPDLNNDNGLHPYFHNLLKEGISSFVQCRILTFPNAQELPIHFIGTIAHFSRPIIEEVLPDYQLQLGNIVRHPIEGLIQYYQKTYFR